MACATFEHRICATTTEGIEVSNYAASLLLEFNHSLHNGEARGRLWEGLHRTLNYGIHSTSARVRETAYHAGRMIDELKRTHPG